MSWQDGEPSQPLRMQTVPFLRSKGQPREGRVTTQGMSLGSPGRAERLNVGRRQECHGSGGCGEGRSKGMRGEIVSIPFDTWLGE